MGLYQQDRIVEVHWPLGEDGGEREGRQSDISACSRAERKKNVTYGDFESTM